MAGYKSETSTAWLSLQVYANARTEVFATTAFDLGMASITDFSYDAGALTGVLFGLDYPLQSASFAGFSNLKARRFTQTLGLNYRLSDQLVLNTMFVVDDNNDVEPWLYDSTGRYVNFFAGLSWIF